jgi:hypothetical protein
MTSVSSLTLDDVLSSRWEEIINSCERREFDLYWRKFHEEADEAESTGNTTEAEVYLLLGRLTSMRLNLDAPNQPFVPMMVWHERRSAILDDFSDEHLSVLEQLVPHVVDAELKARIADVLWVRNRNHRMARIAGDAYLDSAKVLEQPDRWPYFLQRIERALQVARLVNAGDVFERAINYVETLLTNGAS